MKDLDHGLPEHQGGIPPPSSRHGLDVRREVQPCRRGKYLQVRKQGNINPLPDPRWHEVFCQVTPEENTEPASLDQT